MYKITETKKVVDIETGEYQVFVIGRNRTFQCMEVNDLFDGFKHRYPGAKIIRRDDVYSIMEARKETRYTVEYCRMSAEYVLDDVYFESDEFVNGWL